MAFKMKGYSAYTKMTDPPKKKEPAGSIYNVKSMMAEYEKLEAKKDKTEAEIKRMNDLGSKLDTHYGDDNRG